MSPGDHAGRPSPSNNKTHADARSRSAEPQE